MKVAVTYDFNTGEVFQHFGKCPYFLICEIEDNEIKSAYAINTDFGHGCGMRIPPLVQEGVSVIICGNLGGGARNHIAEAGIELYPGVMGDAQEAVWSYIEGNLDYDINTSCAHHPA